MEIWENFKHSSDLKALVIDKTVYLHFFELFKDCPTEAVFLIESPEEEKSMSGLSKILGFFHALNLSKKDLVYAIGGGAVLDLVGFACSIFKRGIRCHFFPTTLLAMVDASIGGKNGINFLGAKNLLGTINEPEKIIFYFPFLKTLNDLQRKSGLAEILKMGLIRDYDLFFALDEKMPSQEMVLHAAALKQQVTDLDLNEKGIRHILNFGHTLGHAIESALKFSIPHGFAVAYGMIVEANISHSKGILKVQDFQKIKEKLIKIFGPLEKLPFSDVLPFLKLDKKNDGQIYVHILKDLGKEPFLEVVSKDEIERAYQTLWM